MIAAHGRLLEHHWSKNEKTQIGNPANRQVVIDVETTGLYPQRGARIEEIGAVAIENAEFVAEFESLIDYGKRIPHQAQAVHGITSEMLAGHPPPEEVLPDFLQFVSRTTLVAQCSPQVRG